MASTVSALSSVVAKSHQTVHSVSSTPSQIPHGGFSPVRFQTGCPQRPSRPEAAYDYMNSRFAHDQTCTSCSGSIMGCTQDSTGGNRADRDSAPAAGACLCSLRCPTAISTTSSACASATATPPSSTACGRTLSRTRGRFGGNSSPSSKPSRSRCWPALTLCHSALKDIAGNCFHALISATRERSRAIVCNGRESA